MGGDTVRHLHLFATDVKATQTCEVGAAVGDHFERLARHELATRDAQTGQVRSARREEPTTRDTIPRDNLVTSAFSHFHIRTVFQNT